MPIVVTWNGIAQAQSFFFSSRRRHTRLVSDWSSDVCSSDLPAPQGRAFRERRHFCHVTVLVSTDKQGGDAKTAGKLAEAATPAASKLEKLVGNASAPQSMAKTHSSRAERVE